MTKDHGIGSLMAILMLGVEPTTITLILVFLLDATSLSESQSCYTPQYMTMTHQQSLPVQILDHQQTVTTLQIQTQNDERKFPIFLNETKYGICIQALMLVLHLKFHPGELR